jgi:peptide/nickel transport system ATP-binding protein
MTDEILRVDDLVVEFPQSGWRTPPFRALKGVSVAVGAGEVLGLAPVTSGTVTYEGRDISHLSRRRRRELGNDIQVVFQDPYTSLNPSLTIGDTLSEPLTQAGIAGAEARRRVKDLLDRVGMPADSVQRLPKEFSGGQRQRIAIARALALEPKLIVCDEPVSALDLTTQQRVLDLFIEIQERTGVAYLFISHDLSVIRHISHRVAVVYHGEVVEQGDVDKVTTAPDHPYTQRLLLASPVPDPVAQAQRRAERRAVIRS